MIMIPLEMLLEKLKKPSKEDALSPKRLELEILPQDAPVKDKTFPTPPPNKRVIIIDI